MLYPWGGGGIFVQIKNREKFEGEFREKKEKKRGEKKKKEKNDKTHVKIPLWS